MLPLYLARIEDLGRGDLLRVDCAACHHVAPLTPEFLLRLGLSPHAKVLDFNYYLLEPKYYAVADALPAGTRRDR